ncbi:GntR family transcriptional regulator [Aliiruegeria haliotis]|uniref:GntR family transcriptional regulator n=1 Tax=Aliiruegeria haliotis TaxID=1280846 RepID=A0A2T0RZH3_9RHOB|nr:GntR family transcriptional regulator [Aliiruegeria haliotis]PRY26550.1 GntR family transcriptional regulator [Aliiruegeria haliotis]
MQHNLAQFPGPLSTATTVTELLQNTTLDPQKNLPFQIFDILRDLIVSVALRPGQRISEKEIASALDASKTPVREALIRLDEIRLVKIVPQSGTYVTRISMKRHRTACFIRLQLELGAVRAAAMLPPLDRDLHVFDTIVSGQTQALAAGDLDRFFILDEAFHRQIFAAPGLEDVWATARRSQFDVNRARHIKRLYRILRGGDVLREHSAIVEAIRAGNPDRAEAALREHIGNLDREIRDLFDDDRLLGFIEGPEAP